MIISSVANFSDYRINSRRVTRRGNRRYRCVICCGRICDLSVCRCWRRPSGYGRIPRCGVTRICCSAWTSWICYDKCHDYLNNERSLHCLTLFWWLIKTGPSFLGKNHETWASPYNSARYSQSSPREPHPSAVTGHGSLEFTSCNIDGGFQYIRNNERATGIVLCLEGSSESILSWEKLSILS